MFVPRQVRQKRKSRNKTAHVYQSSDQQICADVVADSQSTKKQRIASDGPSFTKPYDNSVPINQNVAPPDPTGYYAEILQGLELVFSNHALHDSEGSQWLKDHYRSVNNCPNYVHLSSFVCHPLLARMNPVITQKALQKALLLKQNSHLQLSEDGHYVRRMFTPDAAVAGAVDTNWDAHTIYVEPDISSLCSHPAKLAHFLSLNSKINASYFPIQAVKSRHPSWAFVILAKEIASRELDDQSNWPANWICLTKKEHAKRDQEYMGLLKQRLKASRSKEENLDNERISTTD